MYLRLFVSYITVLLLTAASPSPSTTHEVGTASRTDLRRLDDYAGQAADYDAWARLSPLEHRAHGTEIRVWSGGGLSRIVIGWVVTSQDVRIYSNEIVRGKVHEADDRQMRQVKRIRTKDARELLELFSKFADLNGKAVVCPMLDGVGYTIEGSAEGHNFAFYAGNPGHCENPRAQAIAHALALLPNWR